MVYNLNSRSFDRSQSEDRVVYEYDLVENCAANCLCMFERYSDALETSGVREKSSDGCYRRVIVVEV